MRKTILTAAALAMISTQANALSGFSTCHAAGTTATSISGFNTSTAKMISAMALPDVMEACSRNEQLGGAALTAPVSCRGIGIARFRRKGHSQPQQGRHLVDVG
jgi:hypothetical protein